MKKNTRYLRQISLPEVSEVGQDRLQSSTAVIVGCGGLASPVLTYLTAAGVGTIVLVDTDKVELTDLNRQFLYEEKNIGEEKVYCAKSFLEQRNSSICVKAVNTLLTKGNAEKLIQGAQVVLDCVDKDETRLTISRACRRLQIPLIEAGISGFYGYVLPILPGVTACIECIKRTEATEEDRTIPVIGATAGVIGSLQAMEGLKILLGLEVNYGIMLQYDGLHSEFTSIPLRPRTDCICHQRIQFRYGL